MKSDVNIPSQGDIIMLKQLPNNAVRSALMLNKRYKFSSNYSASIINSEANILNSLTLKQAILLETPYAHFDNDQHLLEVLKTPFSKQIVEQAIEYLGDLNRPCKNIEHREYLYLSLISLFLQQRNILIIDKINFENNLEIEQLFIRTVLSFKNDKTTIITQQGNGLDLICNQIVSMHNNQLITEKSHCKINNIEMLSHHSKSHKNRQQDHHSHIELKKVI